MRIIFDMDGTITEGRYLEPPRSREMYMGLAPFDKDMTEVLTNLIYDHEVYILTARSDPRADLMVKEWLTAHVGYRMPTAILTNPFPFQTNLLNGLWKRDIVKLLDPQVVFDDSPYVWAAIDDRPCYLMDNPGWVQNQEIDTATRTKSWKEIEAIIESINRNQPYQSEARV